MNRPDRSNKPPGFEGKPALPLVELPPRPEQLARFIDRNNSYLRVYMLGECSVIVTKEYGLWHLSIAHKARHPSWDEIAEARYRLIPDWVYMVMALPSKREYVNIHPNCFQLQQTMHDDSLLQMIHYVATGEDASIAPFFRTVAEHLQGG